MSCLLSTPVTTGQAFLDSTSAWERRLPLDPSAGACERVLGRMECGLNEEEEEEEEECVDRHDTG